MAAMHSNIKHPVDGINLLLAYSANQASQQLQPLSARGDRGLMGFSQVPWH